MEHKFDRPLTVAILALGGQGGGVLTRWLVDIARSSGYLVQSTYVAGVAQRTGATVYCVELFPQPEAGSSGREPVFTTYPVPGDVDLVVVGEFAETGRAIQKGFVTPNITTLIASTHRVYSVTEKSAMGDGIIDQAPVVDVALKAARKFIAFDMAECAEQTKSVISAVLLGAIAASRALPFERAAFEAAIRASGKAVEANLAGFEAGFERGSQSVAVVGTASGPAKKTLAMPAAEGPNGEALLARICSELPEALQAIAAHGALRALDYQDSAYAGLYLDRLQSVIALEREWPADSGDFAVSYEVARQLALQMCYEDTIRVAEIKTSGQRMQGVRKHLNVSQQQPTHVVEYFHPRFEELCDTLPRSLGQRLLQSARARRWTRPLLGKGRNITTTKVFGYLQLATLARLKRWRRGTYRFVTQTRLIEDWLARIHAAGNRASDRNYALAIAQCIGMVKGYGDTYERGLHRYQKILVVVEQAPAPERAELMQRLSQAAQADEEGKVFAAALQSGGH